MDDDQDVCGERIDAEDGLFACSLAPDHAGQHRACWDHNLSDPAAFIMDWGPLDLPTALEPVEIERWLADGHMR